MNYNYKCLYKNNNNCKYIKNKNCLFFKLHESREDAICKNVGKYATFTLLTNIQFKLENNFLSNKIRKIKNYFKEKQRQNKIMIFDPINISNEYIQVYPFKKGERILYLFEIKNMEGHCAVITNDGKTYFGYHIENFRFPNEDEL